MTATFQRNILSTEYNGWENYETWNVALWINNEEGLYELARVASFIGMAPSTNPKFIMSVMIDNPKKYSYYGGTVAGPVFKEVMIEALKLFDVPYDIQLNENLLDIKMDAAYEDSRL